MSVKTLVSTLLVCFTSFGAVAPAFGATGPQTIRLRWDLTVDADGKVVRLENPVDLPGDVKERLEREIRTWHFTPGSVGGRPAVTESRLHVALQATPIDGDRLALRVMRAQAGGDYARISTPAYPAVSAKARRQGLVLLRVRYDGNGRVVEASLHDKGARVDTAMVEAARAAVMGWVFKPEVVGGHALGSTALVPFCFELPGVPFDASRCEWSRPRAQGPDAKQAGDDATPAFDSVLKLDTAVAGRAL